jgi:hypothetical protein
MKRIWGTWSGSERRYPEGTLRQFLLLALLAAAINVILLTFLGAYDVRLGPIHLAAHELFKPLLYLDAAVLLAMAAASGSKVGGRAIFWSPNSFWIALLVTLLYLPSLSISATEAEWTHQLNSAAHNSLAGLGGLFVSKQLDGFYRPLVFLSLWADYRIFGDHEWGYHLQNIFFHVGNCLLLVRLGVRLGFDIAAARSAAFLFGVAAANYEPVIWPGARFDLLAAFFTLLALLAALAWLRGEDSNNLWWMALCYTLALLCKESAYCFPVLLLFLIVTAQTWGLRGWSIPSAAQLLGVAAGLSVLMLGIRWAIYGGMGGYPDASGVAPHFALRLATFTSFFTRALPVPVFGLNTNVALPWWAGAAVVVFTVSACACAMFAGGSLQRKIALLIAALISALPAVNLVDWVSPMMRNTRYLYLPAMWICFLLASAAMERPRARWWLLGMIAANAVGAYYNYYSFHWFDWAPRPSAL